MKSMMKDNNDQMNAIRMTGKPDIDAAMMMKIHHQSELDMAESLLRTRQDPQMRKMANSLTASQK